MMHDPADVEETVGSSTSVAQGRSGVGNTMVVCSAIIAIGLITIISSLLSFVDWTESDRRVMDVTLRQNESSVVNGVRIHPMMRALSPVFVSEVRSREIDEGRSSVLLENLTGNIRTIRFLGVSCNCLKVERNGVTMEEGAVFDLVPGERGAIDLVIGLSGDAGVQRQHAFVDVLSDHSRSVAESSIQVEVLADVSVKPAAVEFRMQDFARGAPVDQNVDVRILGRTQSLHYGGQLTAAITGLPKGVAAVVSGENSSDEFSGKQNGSGKRIWEKHVRLTLTATPGRELDVSRRSAPVFSARLTAFDPEANPVGSVVIPIRLRRTAGVDAPIGIAFGAVPVGQSRERRFLVTSVDDIPFQIEQISIEQSGKVFDLQWPVGHNKQHWCTARFHPSIRGDHSAVAEIVTNHPNQREPILITFRGSGWADTR